VSICEVGERLDGSDNNDVGLARFLKDDREVGCGIGAELNCPSDASYLALRVGHRCNCLLDALLALPTAIAHCVTSKFRAILQKPSLDTSRSSHTFILPSRYCWALRSMLFLAGGGDADPVAALAMVYFLVREGIEAVQEGQEDVIRHV